MDHLRDEKNKALGFKGVHYVVAKSTAENILREQAEIWPEFFKIESLPSFMNEPTNDSFEASDFKVAKSKVGESAELKLVGDL